MNTFWLACFAVLGWDFLSQFPWTNIIKTRPDCQKPSETCECLQAVAIRFPYPFRITAAWVHNLLCCRWKPPRPLLCRESRSLTVSWLLKELSLEYFHKCSWCTYVNAKSLCSPNIARSHTNKYIFIFIDDAPDAIQVRKRSCFEMSYISIREIWDNLQTGLPSWQGTSWTTTTLLSKHPDRDPPRSEVLHFGIAAVCWTPWRSKHGIKSFTRLKIVQEWATGVYCPYWHLIIKMIGL